MNEPESNPESNPEYHVLAKVELKSLGHLMDENKLSVPPIKKKWKRPAASTHPGPLQKKDWSWLAR
jgi:hypothetical protein